jgi:hypothetical protein
MATGEDWGDVAQTGKKKLLRPCSSDSESAQLLSFLSHREAKNAGLSTGQFGCSFGALIGAEPAVLHAVAE